MDKIIARIIGQAINLIALVLPRHSAKLALSIFATPRKGSILDNEKSFLSSAEQHLLEYEGMAIMTYKWPGTKGLVLLVHGWESNAFRWKPLIQHLQIESFGVIALDAPAHGQSGSKVFNAILYAEFINVLADKFNPEIIIGHSVGGMASVFYQHKYLNPNLNKMVLLGAPAHFTGVLARYVKMMGYNRRVDRGMKDLIKERFGHFPDYYSAAKFTSELSADGLIIHDKLDQIIPFDDARLYHEHYPNSELISTTGMGHGLKAHVINNTIMEFILR